MFAKAVAMRTTYYFSRRYKQGRTNLFISHILFIINENYQINNLVNQPNFADCPVNLLNSSVTMSVTGFQGTEERLQWVGSYHLLFRSSDWCYSE